jgi:hypothetical protein
MCAAADFFSERLLRHSPAVSLLRDKAAVDHQLRTGDKRGFVRSQEQHPVGHLDRFPDPAQRCHRDLIGALTGIGCVQHRWHIAGVHGFDPDIGWAISDPRVCSRSALRLSDDWAMNKINFAGSEIAASRQRGISVRRG